MKTLNLSSKLPKILRWMSITLLILALLAIISWFAVPPLAKHIVEQQIETQIGRRATIGEIRFNPLTFTLTASDFSLFEPDKVTTAFSAKKLELSTSLTSIYRLAPVLSEAKLIEPKLHIVRTSAAKSGRYNFSDILDRILAKPKSNGTTLFSVSNIQLENGAIQFDDQVTGKKVKIESLNVGLPYVSNFPSKIDIFVQPHLSAIINGTTFNLKGRSKPFSGNQETSLAFDIDQLDLASYAAFSPVALPINIQSSKLSTQLDLTFSRNKNQPEVALSGKIKLDDLALKDKANNPLLYVQSINTQLHKLNLLNGDADIDKIEIKNPEVWSSLNHQGQLNWAMLKGATKPSPIQSKASPNTQESLPKIILTKLDIQGGTLNWQDATNASPVFNTQLKNITLLATKLSSAKEAPPSNFILSSGTAQNQDIQFAGTVSPLSGDLSGKVHIAALPLALYQPYMNRVLAASVSGELSLNTLLDIHNGQLELKELRAELNALKATSRSTPTNTISAQKINLENTNVNTLTKTANISAVRLQGLQSDIRRDAQGKINLEQFILATPKTKRPTSTQANSSAKKTQNNWTAHLNQLAINDSHVSLTDNTVTPAVQLRADGLNLTVENISSKLDTPLKVGLKTQLNKTGKLIVDGMIAAQFKSLNLAIDAQNLPITAVQPYFTDYLNIVLAAGQASAKGKLQLTPPVAHQQLHTTYNGNFRVNNLRAIDKVTSDGFLKWNTLDISGINANIGGTAQSVTLSKITLDNFYARLILSEAAKLNLQDVIVAKNTPPGSAPKSVTSDTPADTTKPDVSKIEVKPAVAVATVTEPKSNSPVIKIGQVILKRGNINYTDNFVKPHYTANLTNMNGSIGAVSSDKPQAAPIDLNGKIDNDAPVTISGSLNPLFKPMFLDIKASANGVELPRLTPYAAKYAGYAIEKGKLSMDVNYHIENDKLVAQNNVRIDQLTFGDRIESPTATKLPVLLAVALLKDRHGQININLPISGTLSDPQFSIGGIIVRIFINLITKAVTSPFALISSAFGGGDELGYAEFAPGSAVLTKEAQGKLDTIAKALIDRPALKMDLVGRADPKTDSIGISQNLLNRKIKSLKRKDNSELNAEDSLENPVTDADKQKYMGKVYSASKFEKPHNFIGLNKSLPPAEMEKLIVTNTAVSQDDLVSLANQRSEAIRTYLQTKGEIGSDRIFLIAPKLTSDGIKDKGGPNRVDFVLK
ncbi:DUF748 domain-containing protein [Aquirhabdus parva]|uniref:DUF748 domain-containing protein n=1 Tax=Aquirhabdus parva TaxID=2283318 RepID=A0A345P504_9GAMM|nr:DUF748 domain-containing protein [Aquirhabdus parva]AXI02363.1 DUF748 domain-containing protein [Aquirhabdus parva]